MGSVLPPPVELPVELPILLVINQDFLMRSKRSFGRKRRVARRKVRVRKTARRKSRRMPITGFPASKVIRLKYVETFALDPAASSVGASYIFRAADIFDPNYTGTGHQPLAHDTWAVIYQSYDVIKSTCKFTYTNRAPSGGVEGQYVMWAKTHPSTAYSVTVDTVLEQSGLKKKILTSSNDKSQSLTISYRKKGRYGTSTTDTRTGFGNSPAEQTFFILGCQSLFTTLENALGNPPSIFVVAEINYTVKVDSQKAFLQS